MARILVVGADIEREQALLRRLRRVAALPEGRVRGCRDLDDCDLLVIRDTPALRNAAANLLRGRPRLHCWVEDQHGRLLGGESGEELDDHAIASALHGMQLPVAATAHAATMLPELARGSHAITQVLRQRLPLRNCQLMLKRQAQPLLLLDLAQDQAQAQNADGELLMDTIVEEFDALSLHEVAGTPLQMVQERPRLPLRPLLWQWGLRSNQWHALDHRLRQGAAVRMSRWPDFRVLGHDHDGFRLCSLLLKRAHTVQQCAGLLDLPDVVVSSFVHAAYLSGHAQLEEVPAAIAYGGSTSPPGSLLARMWRSMRGRA